MIGLTKQAIIERLTNSKRVDPQTGWTLAGRIYDNGMDDIADEIMELILETELHNIRVQTEFDEVMGNGQL